jgi:cytochrome c-type biogenesis protein CcmH/NrfF
MSALWAMPVATLVLAAAAVAWTTTRLGRETHRLRESVIRLDTTRSALVDAAAELRRAQGAGSAVERGR